MLEAHEVEDSIEVDPPFEERKQLEAIQKRQEQQKALKDQQKINALLQKEITELKKK